MKYAVISDIHSNLEALTRVLGEVGREGADKIICLGDVVGYGADPNECVRLVRERCDACLIGNHDSVACGLEEPEFFNPMARDAALWTRAVLSEDNKEYLRSLPSKLEIGGFVIVHGAISHPDKYITSPRDAAQEFALMQSVSLCFFGHTHVMGCYRLREGRLEFTKEHGISVEHGAKYLVNPGSVGQPRDRDPRASFLIFEPEGGRINFFRIDYDIERAQRKIVEAGLDPRLALRLSYGF
jgi:predicted phosphodiesterase